ncbi:ewing's tumor-associated antigen 1 homolog isoform X2 [Scyliorhinus canicula]|uniref:ewing's tumor-associated antigen 1 homolog isoform X2 n=1 Tax=Scyliorhinus canicula TaxID=7830 RepID=UPI0018F2CE38|nr:ewing's tumor-associated antigen 1 homolog isoform X2 [Scyliorhinus canicula]
MKQGEDEKEETATEAAVGRRRRIRLIPSPGPPGERGSGRGPTPPARTGRLSRGSRSAARPRAAEVFSYKTPKRILRKQQLVANRNSPVNDSELQQDIYWDQHSPTAFKLENGKKSFVVCQHAVEISDVVKRIAPQRSSEVPLNIWLGEDAIQCSPTVSFRERIKASNSRFQRSSEEELMKLAKEFDRNMVEQDIGSAQEASEVNWTSDCADLEQMPRTEQPNDYFSALGQVPVTGATGPGKDGVGSTLPIVELHCQNSSQKSLDLETEAAVNALFDGPTQHTGRPLSQGLSSDGSSSPTLDGFHTPKVVPTSAQDDIDHSKGTNITRIEDITVSSPTCKQASEHQASKPVELDAGRVTLYNNAANSKHGKGFACEAITTGREINQQSNTNGQSTVHSIGETATLCTSETVPEDDGFDDWENDDWMTEDSFVMQVTQNPELIAIPEECTNFTKQSNHTLDAAKRNVTKEFNDSTNPKTASGMVPSLSLMQQMQCSVHKAKDTEMVAKTLQFEKRSERPKPRATFVLQSKSSSKVAEQESLDKFQQSNVFKPVVDTLIQKEPKNPEVSKPQCSSHQFNGPLMESTSLTHTKPFNRQTLHSDSAQKNTKDCLVSTSCSVPAKLNSADRLESGKASSAGSQRRVDAFVQSAPPEVAADDWNDEKFSSEIQNMFTELDNLWEIGDDDDDLNRMCEDVEKLIQSQNSEVTTTSETTGLKIANGNQSLTNNATLTSGMQKNQLTEGLDGQQKHLNYNQSSLVSESKIFSKGLLAAKQNAAALTRHLPRPTGFTCMVCSTTTLPTQSHHFNSQSNFQGKSSNTTHACKVSLNRSNSVPGSRNGVGISTLLQASITANCNPSQKLCTATVSPAHAVRNSQHTAGIPRTPRFTFTKITDSSLMSVRQNTSTHVIQSAKTFGNRHHVKSPMEKNGQSDKVSAATQYPAAPLKRHFSDSTLQTKVVEKPVAKCSMQEIEQKKLAALARRKMKMHVGYAHPSSM